MNNEWKILETEKVLKTPVFEVYKESAVNPRNGKHWDFFHFECPANWVTVVAITKDDQIIFVRQFRFGNKKFELEVPGGLVEKGELPLNAGVRELKEETGYIGSNARIIGEVSPNPALQNNLCYTVLVENAEKVEEVELDHAEDIETLLVPVSEIRNIINKKEITHGLVLNALYFYDLEKREWSNKR